jgi:hypothetical protein
MVNPIYKACIHWPSLLAKQSAALHHETSLLTCLGNLGPRETNRSDPICVVPPKVAKAGSFVVSFANVKMALRLW